MMLKRFFKKNDGYMLQLIIALVIVGALSYGVLNTYSGSVETRSNELKTNMETDWQPNPMTAD